MSSLPKGETCALFNGIPFSYSSQLICRSSSVAYTNTGTSCMKDSASFVNCLETWQALLLHHKVIQKNRKIVLTVLTDDRQDHPV